MIRLHAALLRHQGMSPDLFDTSLCELAVSRSLFLSSLGTRDLGSGFLLSNDALNIFCVKSLASSGPSCLDREHLHSLAV